MSSAELRKLSLQQTREAFQRQEGDCGSSEVQGACTDLHLFATACHDTCGAVATVHLNTSCAFVSCSQETRFHASQACCCTIPFTFMLRLGQQFQHDCWSPAVAALTTKIKAMAAHMRVHRKDYHSRRGLQAMLNERRTLLQYLRRKDFDAYAIVLSRLGLKDNYLKLVGVST